MSFKFTREDASEWRANWTVALAAALGLALMQVGPMSIGVFMSALETEFGWKRATIASVLMVHAVIGVSGAPVIGYLVDRFGPRRLAITGSVLMCLSFSMFSLINDNPVSWLVMWGALALCIAMISPVVWTAGISSLFRSSRGLALAVALCGTGITASALPVMGTMLIQNHGWRMAYIGIALAYAVIVLPVIFLFFTSASDRRRIEGGSMVRHAPDSKRRASTRQCLMQLKFFMLAIAGSTMVIVASVNMTFIPIMTSFGFTAMTAASLAGIMGVAGVIGRLANGYLIDRFRANVVAAAGMILPMLALLPILLLPSPVPLAFFAAMAVIFGLSVGAELDSVAYLVSRYFGLDNFAMLFAIVSAGQTLTFSVAPIALNHAYDLTGSYKVALWAVIPACILGATLFLALGKAPALQADDAPAAGHN